MLGAGRFVFAKPMPPEPVQDEPVQPSRPALSERMRVLVKGLRACWGRAAAHPWITAELALAAVVVLGGGLVTVWLVLLRGKPSSASAVCQSALEALDRGAWEEAKESAQSALAFADQPEVGGVPSYVLGVVAFQEALRAKAALKRVLWLVAARYLQDALSQGLPDDRRAHGQFLLGKSLYEAGDMGASRSVLSEALSHFSGGSAEMRFVLAAACLHDSTPKLEEALKQNQLYLADAQLTHEQRGEGVLQQAEILLAMGRPDECLSCVEQISREARQWRAAGVLRGRTLLAQAQAAKAKPASANDPTQSIQKLQAAVTALREVLDKDDLRDPITRQATYLIGLCLLESGDVRGAQQQFARLRGSDPASPEYLAAAYQEAGLLRSPKRDAEAAAACCRALKAIGDVQAYRNPWVSLGQLRDRALEAYQHNLESRGFSAALELARCVGPTLAPERAVELEAATYRAWGRDRIAQSENLPPSKAEPVAREGRLQLRRASRAFYRLATLRTLTRHYPDDLWESAGTALEGHDYRTAARLFEEYLKQTRGRQAAALAGLGEAPLSVDRVDPAIAALRQCNEFYPRDVAALRARLLASHAYREQGDAAKAVHLLEDNLSGDALTPASREYRESLLALGRLLYEQKQYDQAVRRLEEFVNRYSGVRSATEARYLIADCYRQAGLACLANLQQDAGEQARAARTRKARESFTAALDWYRQTQKALLSDEEAAGLGPTEKLMLRNCYFFIGSLLVELGEHDAAIKAYTAATGRYPNSPETLDAYVQMARAFRALNKAPQARGTVAQAKLLLARMKPEAPFEQTTNYTRSQWAAVLDRLDEQYAVRSTQYVESKARGAEGREQKTEGGGPSSGPRSGNPES